MNRKLLFLSSLLIVIILAGCGGADNAADDERQQPEERNQIVDELNPEQEITPSNPSGDDKLGFVHYTREQINSENEEEHTVNIDRTSLANMITRIILRNDGFDEAATLVTDDKALIAYGKTDDLEADKGADIAKKTAVSILPGYFDVYVSENEALIQDIQSLHNSSIQDDNYDNTINQIIDRMQQSPQGTEDSQMQD
ncbi:Sporulation lipoprotein YhcN/YlaJ (Spore_YhcN_YlaJ) [Lentibacillus halodurans]|uniref:Sporulation lipoprotein YhcN/YlaJ (Spore_YhcN_YlaJ) n=1 Tax=Lentibacillus halodurans TaxID=237679 RepID=A0A1I0WQN8_9BACI|nr:YhcN/YlaJ family sporulation lipoprotein [Lentibacillus halodurans]SFA90864.1 Sporulation lipoprotein YhcN/YlaJ (Spore_YhcN_YlaJ) [Lentibacillus halodurans]